MREVYSQFNLPLVELVYSSDSRLLLTASKDGYLAVHNVKLQHQPIKMIQVDFPPPHISLAFDPTNSVFGAFGDNGTFVNIYDTVNFSLMNTITIKKDVGKCFVFSPAELQLIVATISNKIRIYDLKVKGANMPLREITNVHRDSINYINFYIKESADFCQMAEISASKKENKIILKEVAIETSQNVSYYIK